MKKNLTEWTRACHVRLAKIVGLCLALVIINAWPAQGIDGSLFFEAESFIPSSDGWRVVDSGPASATQALQGSTGDKYGTASRRVQIVAGGNYRVWVRFIYFYDDSRAPFTLSVMSGGNLIASKAFDLDKPVGGVKSDYLWEYVDVDLSAGEYTLVLAKYNSLNCDGYSRKVDCVLLRPVSEGSTPPDHRDYGPQTYMRATIGSGYTKKVFVHIFADHYRADWYSHHYLSKNGIGHHDAGDGYAPSTSLCLNSGEQTPWCNITRILYQDSGAILNITMRYTYTTRPDRLKAIFEFATAPETAAVVRVMDVTAQPNGLVVVMPPNLVTPLNLSRLGRDLDFANKVGQDADAYTWPVFGRKPTKFPFFVSVGIGGYGTPPDQAVIDRELRTLDNFGFANWSRTTFGGGMWNYFASSYCRPDTNKIMVAAAKRAQELTAAGKSFKDVVYCMLMDEPGGQSLDFMATDSAYQTAFVAWLKRKNLTPADLLVSAWTDVRTVTTAERSAYPALYYFSQRFRTRALGDFMAFQRHALETACGGPIPVNANFSDGATYYANFYGQGVDYFELLDDDGQNAIWSEDWANGASSYQCGAYNVDLMRAAARDRGQQIGHYVIAHANRRPLDVKLKVAGNVARGVRMMKSFSYGVYWGSHEGGPSWSTHVWQNRPQMWGPHAEALYEIGGAEDLIMNAVAPPAKVAILYASSTDIWQLSSIDGNYAYGFDRMHTWMALAHAQIPVDFLSEAQVERGALAGYRVCYLHGPNLTRAAAAKLDAWVNAGGTLVATAGAGARDEYNRAFATIESLLPATRGTLSTLQRFVNSGSYLNILNIKDTVTAGAAKINVLSVRQPLTAKSGTTTRGKFNDNTPAWVYGTKGSGKVHCLGFLPALDYIREALVLRKDLAGKPLDSVSGEDRWRLEQSANPWAYPAAVREAILAPVREAAIDPPVICSVPQVDAVYMRASGDVVIPLANYTLYPLDTVHFSVRVDRTVAYVETIYQGRIPFQQQGNRVSFSVPLASTDYVKIYYKRGLMLIL